MGETVKVSVQFNHWVNRKDRARLLGSVLFFLLTLTLYRPALLSQALENAGQILLARALTSQLDSAAVQSAAQAEVLLRHAANYFQGNRSAWRSLGFALAVQGREEEAIMAWRSVRGLADGFMLRGDQARWSNRFEDAMIWYERTVLLEPSWAEPWYRLGQIYKNQSETGKAIQAYRRAGQQAPDNRDIWYELGRIYMSRQEWSLALEAFEQGVQASTGQVGQSALYFYIGRIRQVFLSTPDLDGARIAYKEALALDNYMHAPWLKAETYYQRGNILSVYEQWRDAVREYQQTLALNPRHYWAHLSLASALWQLDRREEAKEIVRKAIDLQPNRKHAYWRLGNFHQAEGDIAQARAMYNKVLELNPQDKEAREALETLNGNSPTP